MSSEPVDGQTSDKSLDYAASEIAEFLNDLRAEAQTKTAQGNRFERFVQKLFKEHPGEYGSQMFEDVWRWNEDWPGKDKHTNAQDIGVDLVAQLRGSGELCAIQCKFFTGISRLDKKHIDGFITASPPDTFTKRILVTTVEPGPTCQSVIDRWGVHVITHFDIATWDVNFDAYKEDPEADLYDHTKYEPHKYQKTAISDVVEGFNSQEGDDRRGQMIMPCGVGKSVVALWIAEHEDVVPQNGHVLYLVPSIALMRQTMREWSRQRSRNHQFLGVCSDSKIAKINEDVNLSELAMPVTTDSTALADFLAADTSSADLTVVFCTYQSLEAIIEAQKKGAPGFDLVICDEAHRTTGVEGSEFTLVHDAQKLRAGRRLYMTATSRIYTDAAKKKAKDHEGQPGLFSMDAEEIFGPKFHELAFKDAIDGGYLTPYEVIVLMHGGHDSAVSRYKEAVKKEDKEEAKKIDPRDCAKILGCWDALADPSTDGLDRGRNTGQINPETDSKPSLLRSIAFCNKIKTSELAAKYMNGLVEGRFEDSSNPEQLLDCKADHVDGKMNAFQRQQKLDWLRNPNEATAHVLTNARCLTEGVDVPALDAVLFLDPKQSEIDIVQAIGRVMRTSEGKETGYIILPVLVKPGEDIGTSITSSEFDKVWKVLRALRAHDESFNALINTPNLPFEKLPIRILKSDSRDDNDGEEGSSKDNAEDNAEGMVQAHLPFQVQSRLIKGIFEKVADQHYWPRWAAEMADHIEVIKSQITQEVAEYPKVKARYERFLASMQETINGDVSANDLTEMLAQYVVTLPVFEALFRGNNFAEHNPLSRALDEVLDDLDSLGEADLRGEQAQRLEPFYKSVETVLAGIDDSDSEGRLEVLLKLYENFFQTAMPKQFAQLGVAYTPVELVDFVLRSTDEISRKVFGKSLTDKDINIIEPFSGTGTFLNRLLTIRTDPDDETSPYLIGDEGLEEKYSHELHAHEILLLAYFISSIKIEEGYKQRNPGSDYEPFQNLVLTDTFNLIGHLKQENTLLSMSSPLKENHERKLSQSNKKMRIVMSNPPWSAGQKTTGDDNPNVQHAKLEQRISETYAAHSTATLKRFLYNSYVKALRWATDRIDTDTGGIVGFILPNSLLTGNTEAGIRACFEEEFASAWVYNLRGNAYLFGEPGKKEGVGVFGGSTRQGVCLLLLVKNPANAESFKVHYREVDDYLSQAQKLSAINATKAAELNPEDWKTIYPDKNHDWLNQDQASFETLLETANKTGKSNKLDTIQDKKARNPSQQVLTGLYSLGIATGKDDWLYGFDFQALDVRLRKMLAYREDIRQNLIDKITTFENATENNNLSRFKWIRYDKKCLNRDIEQDRETNGEIKFSAKLIRETHYRPFVKTNLYYDPKIISNLAQIPKIFPTGATANTGIIISGAGDFGALATETTPDLNIQRGGGQVLPRFAFPGERSDKPYGEGSDGALLGAGYGHHSGFAPHGLGPSGPSLRLSEQTVSSADGTTPPMPGIEVPDLIGGNQPDEYGRIDNITDWALEHFRDHYKDNSITKDDIWHYLYGALHAQDWRDKYATELTKYLPRIALARNTDFSKFCVAGEQLMSLHLNYEHIDPWPLKVKIGQEEHEGELLTAETVSDASVYRINPKLRWGKLPTARGSGYKTQDRSVLAVNERCQIVGIPAVAGNPYTGDDAPDTPLAASQDDTTGLAPYIVNGRTPLEWAVAQLQITTAKDSHIINDPNKWHVWEADEDAHKLVLHLLRLVRVSVETAQIVTNLPAMPLDDN